MILYFIGALLVVFLLVAALPFLQWWIVGKSGKEIVEYSFPSELIDHKPNNLDGETSGQGRMAMQNRGSVRMAQGHVLTEKDLEEKKAEVYSVPLP